MSLPGEAERVSPVRRLAGAPVAAEVRRSVDARVRALATRGSTPTLGTVLASDDPADERFMALKHAACEDLGIATRDVRVEPGAPGRRVVQAVERLSEASDVHAVFVQAPLPTKIDTMAVRSALDPRKDVDCFHPVNLGRLVTGDPRFLPATKAAAFALLECYGIPTDGRDVVVVGRSAIIGRPLANRLLRRGTPGNATVTVCHTHTRDLASKTRGADIVVTAAGVSGLVDGSMLAEGATVIDVSANHIHEGGELEVVGDVDFESAASIVGAITPVPGGVGPVTIAMLAQNVVLAAERLAGVREGELDRDAPAGG